MIKTAKIVLNWLASERIEVSLLNIGGGFELNMSKEMKASLLSKEYLKLLKLLKKLHALQYNIPEIGIEPGRSIVGEAGITFI